MAPPPLAIPFFPSTVSMTHEHVMCLLFYHTKEQQSFLKKAVSLNYQVYFSHTAQLQQKELAQKCSFGHCKVNPPQNIPFQNFKNWRSGYHFKVQQQQKMTFPSDEGLKMFFFL